ncbi:alpha/beta hydrolase-fold protein [Nocardioides sp.]|uniref:alpha/beta hydrolase n=1 Tax=Nocardioides sp. TaxID=35761 RepID=UPI002603B159|nr:alpha/beta hydrolase-fold protein [Nocardioides sp.]
MGLTGSLLPWVVGLVLVVLLVLIVWGRPRWRSEIAQGATRGLLAMLLAVVVLMQVGIAVNNKYVWYSSWGDLVGNHSSYTTITGGGNAPEPTKVAGAGIPAPTAAANYALPAAGQQEQIYTVKDEASNQNMEVEVHLPAGYDPTSTRKYPILLGLHGYPSSPHGFMATSIVSSVDKAIASHKMGPAIVVVPQINNPTSRDTECLNGPAGTPQTETWLSKELPQWIVNHVHASDVRTGWAAIGYSFGGWCAAFLTMSHPDVYGAGISFSGYFVPSYEGSFHPYTTAQLQRWNLITMAKEKRPPVKVWLFASKQDSIAWPTSRDFIAAAKAPTEVKAAVISVGGHRNSVWEPLVPDALSWLAAGLPGFAA